MSHMHDLPAALSCRTEMHPPFYAEIDVPHWGEIAAELEPTPAAAPATATQENRRYVVVLTSGIEDGGKRATLALSAACTALSLDQDTQVFLIGDGSHWAYRGACSGVWQKGFPPLAELMDTFIELGGKIYVCATCDGVCSIPGASGTQGRRPEIELRGLAAVLSHMIGGGSVTF